MCCIYLRTCCTLLNCFNVFLAGDSWKWWYFSQRYRQMSTFYGTVTTDRTMVTVNGFYLTFLGTARQYHTSNEQIDVRISYKASPRDIVLRCDWCEDKRTILSLSSLISTRHHIMSSSHILPWQYKSTQFNHMFLSILCLETRNDIFLVFNGQTIILFPILYFPGENAASRRSTLSFQTSDQLSLRARCVLEAPLSNAIKIHWWSTAASLGQCNLTMDWVRCTIMLPSVVYLYLCICAVFNNATEYCEVEK